MEAVEQALALCEEDAGPPHLKLVLEWDLQGKERYVMASGAVAVLWVVLSSYAKFSDWPSVPMRYVASFYKIVKKLTWFPKKGVYLCLFSV